MTELLRVRDVTVSYPTDQGVFTAVESVSFAVHERERFVLLGPSGCGKSTLLKSVAGFVPPAAGTLELAGRRITRPDRKSTRLNSSHSQISYAVFCLKKKKKKHIR